MFIQKVNIKVFKINFYLTWKLTINFIWITWHSHDSCNTKIRWEKNIDVFIDSLFYHDQSMGVPWEMNSFILRILLLNSPLNTFQKHSIAWESERSNCTEVNIHLYANSDCFVLFGFYDMYFCYLLVQIADIAHRLKLIGNNVGYWIDFPNENYWNAV